MGLREEVLAKGYVEKYKGKGYVYYADNNDQVIAKTCRDCDELRLIEEFRKKSSGLGNRSAQCKSCASIRDKDYYNKNRERLKQVKYAYYRRKRAEQLSFKLFEDND